MLDERQSMTLLLLALSPQAFALAAGLRALTVLRREPGRAGRSLALGGISLAATVSGLVLLLSLFPHKLGI